MIFMLNVFRAVSYDEEEFNSRLSRVNETIRIPVIMCQCSNAAFVNRNCFQRLHVVDRSRFQR